MGASGLCARVSLDEYVERMPEGQRDIYYLVAPGGRKQAGIAHPPLASFLRSLRLDGGLGR